MNGIQQKLVSLKLYKTLVEKEKELDDSEKVSPQIFEIVTVCAPLLERVPENMPEYTLHDPNHGAKVVDIMSKIIPAEVFINLNHLEIALLILSGFLHDIGMTCTKEEKEEIISSSPSFQILFKTDVINYHQYQSYIDNREFREATFIQDQVFTEYLRQNHVKRSSVYIRENLSNGKLELAYNGIPFYEQLIAICEAHGEPVKSLKDLDTWPRNTLIGEVVVDLQYLGLVLRLADILDLDAERTPKLIYEYINPKNPVSIVEWKKHRSIIGHSITAEKILFEAKCTSPEVERALKDFLQWIEIERKETMNLLKCYTDEISKKHYFKLHDEVTADRIKNDGSYVYNDLKFAIDYKRVIELLVGERLYKNPVVAIRELIQNSIDAINIRREILDKRNENFVPLIKITLSGKTFSVEDNGIGMNHHIFQTFFLQAGNSYYSSKEFYAKFSDVDSVSEFGIGILSVFMIATSLKIESRKEPDDPLNPFLPIHFEIPTAYSFTVERKSSRTIIGTKITLTLNDSIIINHNNLAHIIKEIIPNSPYNIEIVLDDKLPVIHTTQEETTFKNLPEIQTDDIKILPRIRRNSNDKEKVYEWIKIDFKDSNNGVLKNIGGYISIINSAYSDTIKGKICQRNFSIGYPSSDNNDFNIKIPESLEGLLPNWLCLYVDVNFTRSACLTMTPDRTEVIVDEKFKVLKKLIEQEIIEKIQLKFKEYISILSEENYVNIQEYLFNARFFNFNYSVDFNSLTSEGIDFLSENILFRFIEPTGKKSFIPLNQIQPYKNIGVIHDRWLNVKLDDCLEFLIKYEICLINFSDSPIYVDNLQECFYLLFTKDFYLTAKHKFLVNDLLPNFYFDLVKHDLPALKSIDNQFINLSDLEKEILVVFDEGAFDLTIDRYHRVFDKLPLERFDKKYSDVFSDLTNTISEEIGEAIKLASTDDTNIQKDIVSSLTKPYQTNFYPALKSIFYKDLTLLDELNNALWVFFEELIEEKLLPEDFELPDLNFDDFPVYWSEDI